MRVKWFQRHHHTDARVCLTTQKLRTTTLSAGRTDATFTSEGANFLRVLRRPPKWIPIHKTTLGLLAKLVIPFHHRWKMQLCQQPGALNSYNPTNAGAWNSCLRCADNTLRSLQRPLLQLMEKQSIAHPGRTYLSDGTASLVRESRLLQPSHRITLHSLQPVTPTQLAVTSKPSLQYSVKRMLCQWRSLVEA
jgi:hypothetical protein